MTLKAQKLNKDIFPILIGNPPEKDYFQANALFHDRRYIDLRDPNEQTLMPNPRAAKRFTNIYRILKAGVHRNDLARFEGVAGMPGEFQVPMFLLAILVGAPAEATLLFPARQKYLDKDQDIRTALSNIKRLAPALRKQGDFQEKIQLIFDNGTFPFAAELFNHWLPKVSRFSFDLGKIMYSFGAKQK